MRRGGCAEARTGPALRQNLPDQKYPREWSVLIKSADDKSKRLELLRSLQSSPLLDAKQKAWLRDEWGRTTRGIQGERDAAFHINSHFEGGQNHVVLHDLRLEVNGEVAQIDHLLINRLFHFYLFETKCFSGEVTINDRGEFSVRYPGEAPFGIPSPLEQSRRHERMLAKLLDRLGLNGRLGTRPTFHHAVLMHPKAIIHRPPRQVFDSDSVIKADQIGEWHDRYVQKRIGLVQALASAVNLVSFDSLVEMARQIARQHRPQDPLQLPDFMAPRPAPQPSARPAVARAPATADVPHAATAAPAQPDHGVTPDPALKRRLVCVACGDKISFAEGKFCWNQEARFGGFQYCRAHQADVAKP